MKYQAGSRLAQDRPIVETEGVHRFAGGKEGSSSDMSTPVLATEITTWPFSSSAFIKKRVQDARQTRIASVARKTKNIKWSLSHFLRICSVFRLCAGVLENAASADRYTTKKSIKVARNAIASKVCIFLTFTVAL